MLDPLGGELEAPEVSNLPCLTLVDRAPIDAHSRLQDRFSKRETLWNMIGRAEKEKSGRVVLFAKCGNHIPRIGNHVRRRAESNSSRSAFLHAHAIEQPDTGGKQSRSGIDSQC